MKNDSVNPREGKLESKYYTPTTDEFCVGFEYEYASIEDGKIKWKKDSFGSIRDSITTIKYALEKGLRVKRLDREDIESLGWEYDDTSGYKVDDVFKYKNYRIILSKESGLSVYLLDCEHDEIEDSLRFFDGTIKNKSELKKLLKQLGI